MTTTEYNSLIANGRYISKPAFEGTFIATIDGRSYFATFCNSRLEKVLAEYSAGEWLAKMAEFVKEGYEFTQVFINENYDGLGRVKQLAFSVKGKAGMDYMVWPTINQNHYDGGAGAAHTVAYIDSKTTCKLGT